MNVLQTVKHSAKHHLARGVFTKSIENDHNLMEKFAEFQPKTIFSAHLLFFGLFITLLVIFACAGMRQPHLGFFIRKDNLINQQNL